MRPVSILKRQTIIESIVLTLRGHRSSGHSASQPMAAGESLLLKDISLRHPLSKLQEPPQDHHHTHSKVQDYVPEVSVDTVGQPAPVHILSHEEALERGFNDQGDCFCEPWWYCCFNRCIRPRNAVSSVGFLDGLFNLFLCGVTTFVILQWQLHIRYIQNRGFLDEKRRGFGRFMEKNEDGMIILATSYGLMVPVSWNLSHSVDKNRRWDGVLWMVIAIYVTSLQIVALVFFPFLYNIIVNVPLILAKVFEFWTVFRMDRLKRRMINHQHVPIIPHQH